MRTDQTFTTRGEEAVLAVSLELAGAKWKVALDDGQREKPAVHAAAQPQAAARLEAVRVIEAGSHADLLATRGVYARLVAHQSGMLAA